MSDYSAHNWADEYEAFVDKTSRVKDKYVYACLGLAGEVGEVIEHVKKLQRGDYTVTPELREKVKLEMGDVLWYLTRLAHEFETDLEDIAVSNMNKLIERQKNGKATG